MEWLYIALGVVGFLVVATLVISYVCFRMCFYSKPRKPLGDEIELPSGELYDKYVEDIKRWVREARALNPRELTIKSHDGLTLRGKYYECDPDGIIEILFHGYRGSGERDLSAGVERCFALGRNALIVDQRAGGTSDGSVITFGILERLDCLRWIDKVLEEFGKDRKIILTGISMGGATVMLASGLKLPENVVCILSDCGYSSNREIICKIVKEMKLPPRLAYPFLKLGARLYGGFSLDLDSPEEAVKRASVPIIFIHGDSDDFVPCYMSEKCYNACGSAHKKLVKVKGAGHGVAYPVDKDLYVNSLREFQIECGF
ncbi:MAG: alpha/beta hydrolase [Clostridia bacterium]|nr:alpha/beta hydrolase [Clostridia bacterium]